MTSSRVFRFQSWIVFIACVSVVVSSVVGQSSREATDALHELADHYRMHTAMVDRVEAQLTTPAGSMNFTFTVQFDDVSSRIDHENGTTFTVTPEAVFVSRKYAAGKYLRQVVSTDVPEVLSRLMGGRTNVPIHYFLRSTLQPSAYMDRLTLGVLQSPSFRDVRDITRDDRTLREIRITGANGSAALVFDPETMLLVSYELFGSLSVGGEGPQPVSAEFTYHPQRLEALPEQIAFEPGERQMVASLSALIPEIGDLAPPFELPTLEGEVVKLESLRGNVVILDFWATWCGPCKRGLPLLDRFAQTVAERSDPVRIFAVDVMERHSRERIDATVRQYWDQEQFTFPTLMDYTSETVRNYGISSIPLTLVIDPNGRITARHDGFNENMVAMLERDVALALQSPRAKDENE